MTVSQPKFVLFSLALILAPTGIAFAQTAGPLTLGEAVSQAIASNPVIQAARQQFVQAQAQFSQAEAGRRFQITFNSTTSGTNADYFQPPPAHQNSYLEQNTLTIPLPVGRRPGLYVSQAGSQLRAAQAQFTAAQAALAFQVDTAYFDLLRKQALLEIAQETLAQDQRQLAETQARSRAGDVPQLDVLRAQVPVAQDQATLVSAENDVLVAEETLNNLLGQPLDAPLTLADISPQSVIALPLTLEQARTQALASAPDLQAAQDTVEADRMALQAAQLFREPNVSVQIVDARSNDRTGFSRADTVLASVSLPLSDGGLGRAQMRAAQAALAGAQAQVEVVRRTDLATVSAAFLTAQSTRDQVAAAATARDIARISAEKTALGYRNGLFPLSDMLNARAAFTQAEIAYTQAVYGAAAAASALNAALNGGLAVSPAAPTSGQNSPPISLSAPGTGVAGASPSGSNTPGASPAGSTAAGTSPGGTNAPVMGTLGTP